ncbi:MAG: phage tail protein [Chloroflexales bacterium]|nr:phage tail protein [Chloroflexales bacterium]
MPTGFMADRYKGFKYLVEIDGVTRAAFGYCAGLSDAMRPIEFFIGDDEIDLRDVADPEHDHPVHIVLAEGIAFDDALYAWQRTAAEGHAERHDGEIVELDSRGHVRASYHFRGGWPCFYQGARGVGAGPALHIDTLELVYDDLSRN